MIVKRINTHCIRSNCSSRHPRAAGRCKGKKIQQLSVISSFCVILYVQAASVTLCVILINIAYSHTQTCQTGIVAAATGGRVEIAANLRIGIAIEDGMIVIGQIAMRVEKHLGILRCQMPIHQPPHQQAAETYRLLLPMIEKRSRTRSAADSVSVRTTNVSVRITVEYAFALSKGVQKDGGRLVLFALNTQMIGTMLHKV